MPQFGGGGIAQGASPITSGVASAVAGLFQALSDGADPGVVQMQDDGEVDHYLNVGSAGVLRFGINDPVSAGDPDVNPPLASASGGLAVDGSNWMTGRFMSADDTNGPRISSRQGILTSVNDDFDTGSLDANLWTATGTPSGFAGEMILNDNGEGVRSTYTLDGDFDIRWAADTTTGNSTRRFLPRVTYSTAADAEALNDATASPDVVKITCSVNTSTWAYEFVASVNNVQIGTTGSVPGSAGFSHFSVRFVRSGGAFSLYYRVPTAAPQDPSTEGDWVQLGATTAYAPTRPGGQVATGVTSSAVYAAEEFYSKSSSPVPATATGPQWRIGSLATLPAGEPLVEWYLGPETVTANLYALHEHDADGDVVFTIGQRDVFRGILQAEAETGGSEPGLLSLVDAGGVANYLWVANTTLRISQNTKPATPDAGFAIGPLGYGGIYVTAGAAPQPTNATPGTFDVVTGFTTNYGPSQFVAPDAANDRVTAAVDGDYFVEWHVSLTGDAANPTTYTFAVFSDGVEVPGSRGAVSTVDASTLVDVMGKALFTPAAAGDQVDLRVAATEASADVTPVEAQLVLMRLGG